MSLRLSDATACFLKHSGLLPDRPRSCWIRLARAAPARFCSALGLLGACSLKSGRRTSPDLRTLLCGGQLHSRLSCRPHPPIGPANYA